MRSDIGISHQVRYTPHSLQLHHPDVCKWKNRPTKKLYKLISVIIYVSTFQVSKIPRDCAILQGDVLWFETCDMFAHATSGCFVVLPFFGVHYAICRKNVHSTYWLCKHRRLWNINMYLYTEWIKTVYKDCTFIYIYNIWKLFTKIIFRGPHHPTPPKLNHHILGILVTWYHARRLAFQQAMQRWRVEVC